MKQTFQTAKLVAVLIFLLEAAAFAVNPIPTVVGPPIPQAVVPGSGAFTLKVYGANFISGAVVNWNRSPRSTTFISARELEAHILASDVAKPTAGYITVTNPPPGGGVSSSSYSLVEVHQPTSTIIVGPPHVYLKNIGSEHLVLADFNNDGIFDFAVDDSFSEIKVFLGNGDGTFQPGAIATHNYYGSGPAAIASGDFNNDGNEDLVFGSNPNGPPTQLEVISGEGNGKFTAGTRFGHFNGYALGIAVGDFNKDGNLDLASVTAPDTLSVFLSEGNGSFRHPENYSYSFTLGTPFEVLPADLNGDGVLDLIVLVGTDGVYIQLGKGDGTFQKPRRVVANAQIGCSFGPGLVVSDFNSDGKTDLAFCERDSTIGKLWIMMGNGDGTFKKPSAITIPSFNGVFSFVPGDFNSDGKTDLIVNYLLSDNTAETDLYLGNGDGTFQRKKMNSDGLLDTIFQAPGEIDVFSQK